MYPIICPSCNRTDGLTVTDYVVDNGKNRVVYCDNHHNGFRFTVPYHYRDDLGEYSDPIPLLNNLPYLFPPSKRRKLVCLVLANVRTKFEDLRRRVNTLSEGNGLLNQEIEKLQAFKDWVHNHLDQHGVPHYAIFKPTQVNNAEENRGDYDPCRRDWLFERMDWLFNQFNEMKMRLAEIDRGAQADADDLEKMRDGTHLSRRGVVEIIVYQQQDIAELKDRMKANEIALKFLMESIQHMPDLTISYQEDGMDAEDEQGLIPAGWNYRITSTCAPPIAVNAPTFGEMIVGAIQALKESNEKEL